MLGDVAAAALAHAAERSDADGESKQVHAVRGSPHGVGPPQECHGITVTRSEYAAAAEHAGDAVRKERQMREGAYDADPRREGAGPAPLLILRRSDAGPPTLRPCGRALVGARRHSNNKMRCAWHAPRPSIRRASASTNSSSHACADVRRVADAATLPSLQGTAL